MTPPTKIKLSDFGLCKKVSHQETFSQSGLKGTMNWMAPEMIEIMNDPENQMEQLPHGTIGSDTFSAGCVFFYFLTRGKHPFGKSHHLLTNILEAKPVELEIFEQNLQKEDSGKLRICHIIKNMICIKEKRIALPDVIEHLTPLLIAHRQFKETERVIPGYDKVACLFNPTKPVLACSVKHEVIFFTAANGFIPFSNWKQSELKLQAENTNKITALQWNYIGSNRPRNQIALGFRNGVIKILEINSSLTKASCTATFPVDDPTRICSGMKILDIWSRGHPKEKLLGFGQQIAKNKVTDESEVDRRKLPQSFIFACGTADGDVLIWNPLENDEKLRTLTRQHSKPLVLVVFSPDGRFLASADTNNKIVVWSTETWDPVFITRSPSLYSLKFSWLFTTSSTDASGYKFAFYTYGIYGSTVKVIEYAITETNDVQQPSVG
ncbi:hypothetical protein OUZ56_005779 [Daphnia magna]|nr:hypothetical protein OUZ56_005779 [Daphnia magna]